MGWQEEWQRRVTSTTTTATITTTSIITTPDRRRRRPSCQTYPFPRRFPPGDEETATEGHAWPPAKKAGSFQSAARRAYPWAPTFPYAKFLLEEGSSLQ